MINRKKLIKHCIGAAALAASLAATCWGEIIPFPAPSALPPCIIEYSSIGPGGSSSRVVLYRADHTYEELLETSDGLTVVSGAGEATVLHSGSYTYAVDPSDQYHASITYGGGQGVDQLYFDSPTSGGQQFAGEPSRRGQAVFC